MFWFNLILEFGFLVDLKTLKGNGWFSVGIVSTRQVINHMTCFNSSALIGGKFTFEKRILYKICSPVWMLFYFQLMRALKFIIGHVIYNPAYNYKLQLKTTILKLTDLYRSNKMQVMFSNMPKFSLIYSSLSKNTWQCTSRI